ncbi:hypothetical protein ACFL6W_05705 [Thermodesulfobacteriota bacterium]
MSANIVISGILINQVRLLYDQALEFLSTNVGFREGINGYTQHAIPAYILCVASVEAFVNESFISPWSKVLSKDSSLWNLSKGIYILKRLSIPRKGFFKQFGN